MTDCLTILFDAWGDASADDRAAKTDAVIAGDFTYCDPNTTEPLHGREAYLSHIATFAEMMPGASAKIVQVDEHHGFARATVDFLKDEAPMMRGQYFAELADGRVKRLVGFPGTGIPD